MMEPALEEKLNSMSYEQLIEYEDQLLLQNELSTDWRIRQAGGRFIIFVMGAFFWGVYFILASALVNRINENQRPLFVLPLVIGTLFAGIITSHYAWKLITPKMRFWLRMSVHYWPVTFVLFFEIFTIISRIRND